MSSPTRDGSISSSPAAARGGSPIRRRDSILDGDLSRPRLSPTLVRSFDPNDPQVRERQRTMDVDMAVQLSRARREPVLSSSPTSSFDGPRHHDEDAPFSPLNALSPHEQHEIDVARGDAPHLIHDMDEHDAESLLTSQKPSSAIDLRSHLHQTQDPSLLVSINGPVHQDHPSASAGLGGLPTYQANVSRTHFDFSPMEQFAADEKASLGIGSAPTLRFATGAGPSSSQLTGDAPAQTSMAGALSTPRQRRYSQSTSQPRSHRKGFGGKLALFESNSGEPPLNLPGRLGLPLGGDSLNRAPSADGPSPPVSSPPFAAMDNLNTGHDRLYRFSFYSNALPATIHARSLSELPAEGQSFEDLFGGVSMPEPDTGLPLPTSDFLANKKPPLANPTSSYNMKPPLSEKPTRMSGGVIGGGYQDGTTWWLDVQNPTDDEMKMLSKVIVL
jgi:magnesium transporter